MKSLIFKCALFVILMSVIISVNAQYSEVMNRQGKTVNMQRDYALVDDHAMSDQSSRMQRAVDELSSAGGGCIIIPEGVYRFSGIWMKSNVHILIENGTTIKAWWPDGEVVDVFKFDAEEDYSYVENVSIRGLGGRYTIDYSEHGRVRGEGARFVNVGQVKNFLIADAIIQDNRTVYCAIAVGLSRVYDIDEKPRFRPTFGTVRDCSIYNSHEGYGFTQLHRADNLLFENIYAKGGGVTFRLETGGGGIHAGIHEIRARNVICENGVVAVMMGPHTAQNGTVQIDGVTAISCTRAVSCGSGFIDSKHQDVAEARTGRFADDSYVKNIRVIYGENAVIGLKRIWEYPEVYLNKLRAPESRYMRSFRGPAVGGVKDGSQGAYTVTFENIIMEGFPEDTPSLVEYVKSKASVNVDEYMKDVPDYKLVKELHTWTKNKNHLLNEDLVNKYFGSKDNNP